MVHSKLFAFGDLIAAARNRDKAAIGLPPEEGDLDATAAWMIGTRATFAQNPVKFDRIIFEGPVIDTEHSTEQTVGVVDDQIVIMVVVPDLPDAADVIDELADAAEIGVIIGKWALRRIFKQIARNRIILEIHRIRLSRAKRVAAAFNTGDVRRFKATLKTAKLGRKVAKRTAKGARLIAKTRRIRFVATRVGAKVLFKAVLVVSLVVDAVIVGHRVLKGIQRGFESEDINPVSGGVGALVGGVADVLTLGLAERATEKLEVKTASLITSFMRFEIRTARRFGSVVGGLFT